MTQQIFGYLSLYRSKGTDIPQASYVHRHSTSNGVLFSFDMSSAQKQKAKAEQIIDAAQDEDSNSDADSDLDEQIDTEDIASPSTSQKKKKKKKSRAAKALDALRGKQEIPQELVDHVLDKVQAENAVGSTEATQENVREA